MSVFALIPVVWITWAMTLATGGGRDWSVSDFLTFRAAASALLHGRSPYPVHADPSVLSAGTSFVYPPIAAYPFVPFTQLPAHVAIVVYLLASLAAIAGALWLIGVRDWRVLGVVLLWEPVLMWLFKGPIEPWMLLLLAAGWRWRGHVFRLAAVVAFLVSLKLFLWPLLIWLPATRRIRAFVASVGLTAIFVLVPFAGVGMHSLRSYPHLLQALTDVFGRYSFSLLAVFESLTSSGTSQAATIIVALVLVGVIGFLAAREEGDRRAFSAAIIGGVMLSPIVWAHYFVLLAIPIGLARPRLSFLWFAPLAFWATGAAALGEPHRLTIGVLVPLTVLAVVCRKLAADEDSKTSLPAQSTGRASGSASPAMR